MSITLAQVRERGTKSEELLRAWILREVGPSLPYLITVSTCQVQVSLVTRPEIFYTCGEATQADEWAMAPRVWMSEKLV